MLPVPTVPTPQPQREFTPFYSFAARRAIIRCGFQKDGYDLPSDKYERWRDVVVDFTASGSGVNLR